MTALPVIKDFDDPSFDPFTILLVAGGEGDLYDCYEELARLRRQNPVWEGDIRTHLGLTPDLTMANLRHVAVLGHQEVMEVTRDPVTYSNSIQEHSLGPMFGRCITLMHGDEHTKYRRFFQKFFTPQALARWGNTVIPNLLNKLIDDFAHKGRAELVEDFTLHFPFHFIFELMELPHADRRIFHKLAFGQIAVLFDREHGLDATTKLRNYLTELVLHRREHPVSEHDFIHGVATAEIDGERLPDEIIVSFFRQLMNAGGDTSFHGFSSVLAGLLTHPEQMEMVRRDRSLVTNAIDEGLRWNSPVSAASRTPTREVELGGVVIRPGDHMSIVLGSANRDESVFPNPDIFDITRDTRYSVPFSHGHHICLGRHLARLEMTLALNLLLDRLPKLRMDDDYPPPRAVGFGVRGPKVIHVRFD